MDKKIWITILIIGLLVYFGGVPKKAAGPELLINPSFSDGLTGWTQNPNCPATLDSTIFHSNPSVRLDVCTAGMAWDREISQNKDWTFEIEPDKTYTLSAWVRTEYCDPAGGGCYVGTRENDQGGARMVAHIFKSGTAGWQVIKEINLTYEWTLPFDTWSQIIIEFTTPPESQYFSLGLYGWEAADPAAVWFDDLSLTENTGGTTTTTSSSTSSSTTTSSTSTSSTTTTTTGDGYVAFRTSSLTYTHSPTTIAVNLGCDGTDLVQYTSTSTGSGQSTCEVWGASIVLYGLPGGVPDCVTPTNLYYGPNSYLGADTYFVCCYDASGHKETTTYRTQSGTESPYSQDPTYELDCDDVESCTDLESAAIQAILDWIDNIITKTEAITAILEWSNRC